MVFRNAEIDSGRRIVDSESTPDDAFFHIEEDRSAVERGRRQGDARDRLEEPFRFASVGFMEAAGGAFHEVRREADQPFARRQAGSNGTEGNDAEQPVAGGDERADRIPVERAANPAGAEAPLRQFKDDSLPVETAFFRGVGIVFRPARTMKFCTPTSSP